MAVNLPGQDYQSGHQAHFFLYSVDNPKGLVDEYNRWLDRCSSYHRSGVNPVSGIADNRDVVRHVDTTLPDGADAGLAVDGRAFYYMVRGVMVQAYTKMDGGNCAYLHSDAPRPLAPGLAALSGELGRRVAGTLGRGIAGTSEWGLCPPLRDIVVLFLVARRRRDSGDATGDPGVTT
ncbi:MAG TPA: hypothetical protein VL179_11260, partial [Mycobacterium sp.]|nr:hypothetical protein [Mycobacterium sp.]